MWVDIIRIFKNTTASSLSLRAFDAACVNLENSLEEDFKNALIAHRKCPTFVAQHEDIPVEICIL